VSAWRNACGTTVTIHAISDGQRGGGYDRKVIELSTLLYLIEYIHNNPVRRGLVNRATD